MSKKIMPDVIISIVAGRIFPFRLLFYYACQGKNMCSSLSREFFAITYLFLVLLCQ